MRIKAIVIGLFCTLVGLFLVDTAFWDGVETVWEAVIIGVIALLAGPLVVCVSYLDLMKQPKGSGQEVSDTFRDFIE